ncbi:MAG: hypothetical protein CMQ49_11900 [Gammaproteobacteria bacterium]|nr:hypothetical protein [Gammaproteobacteria bacterium]
MQVLVVDLFQLVVIVFLFEVLFECSFVTLLTRPSTRTVRNGARILRTRPKLVNHDLRKKRVASRMLSSVLARNDSPTRGGSSSVIKLQQR